jgi:hypothetical protein
MACTKVTFVIESSLKYTNDSLWKYEAEVLKTIIIITIYTWIVSALIWQ